MSAGSVDEPRVAEVVLEYGAENLALAVARPRLTWRLAAGPENWRQTAYEIEAKLPGRGVVETGLIESDRSCYVAWPFDALASGSRGWVRVRAHATDGRGTAWSDRVEFAVGLLRRSDWRGTFVGARQPSEFRGALHFRRVFQVEGPVEQAVLHITALGLFVPYLNGQRVGDHVLDPGWTSYRHRICSTSFDVSEHLREGENAIGAVVADGWYRGRIGHNGGRQDFYGSRLGVLAQLEIRTGDDVEFVVSDDEWRASRGPVLFSSLYDGETYDGRAELPGWAAPGFDDSRWAEVDEIAVEARIEPSARPPARRTQVVRPETLSRTPTSLLVDFGQNIVGWVRFEAEGRPGDEIVIRHAEVLERGELCVRPLRTAKATDSFLLHGAQRAKCEPQFTFHGFRYAELSGAVDAIDVSTVDAVVVHSDLERTGWFECSNPELERLHENVVWSTRGNFVTLPTDCPQRDERLGWTGDIQVFAPTACFLYDVGGFLASWLADVAAEQAPDGGVPSIVPDPQITGALPDNEPAAAWADAAVVVPWVLYERLGDIGILERQFESMNRWVGWIESRVSVDGIWERGWQYGDWLDPSAPPTEPWLATTEPALVATAYAARSADIVAQAAMTLGKHNDAERTATLAARLRRAFAGRFAGSGGRLTSDSQTAYALALRFGLIGDEKWRVAAAARLAELVTRNDFHIGTGFVGTPIVCDALCDGGYEETAWRLVLERTCPSWLYPVTMGATTIWERWDSMLPDGSVNSGQMTSFNHYAFGAIGDWLHRYAAGIAPAAPGYRRIAVRPRPGPGLTRAAARLRTPYGTVASEWTLANRELRLTTVVPPNSTAEVFLPFAEDRAPVEVGSGRHAWRVPAPEDVGLTPAR